MHLTSIQTYEQVAEYEALIIGLRWAKEVGITLLLAKIDSQVVVEEITKEFNVNSDRLVEYLFVAQKEI